MSQPSTSTQIFTSYLTEKTSFGYLASELNRTKIRKYQIPKQVRDEIPTLNRFGYMKVNLSEFCHSFLEYGGNRFGINLEIGAAYGFLVSQMLSKGGKIIANDISIEHLEIILLNANKKDLKNLFLYPGKFPEEVNLPAESLRSILISRVFHFLDSYAIEEGLKKIRNWLVYGGKFFFTAVTPYHKALREKFLPIYNARWDRGDLWPGKISSQWEIAPQHKNFVPEFLNVFDIPQLERLIPEYGFKIDKIKLFDYPNDTYSDNKGHVGFIATKI